MVVWGCVLSRPVAQSVLTVTVLLGALCKYLVGPCFAFRTALILCGIESTKYRKHASEFLDMMRHPVTADLSVALPLYKFPVPPPPSSDQATFFQCSIVRFWLDCVSYILHFLFSADRGSTFCCSSPSASSFDMLGIHSFV